MRTKRLYSLMIITVLLALSAALPFALVHASGGLVRPAPACSNAPKAGTVTLHPNGTPNAMELVTFATPFCSGPVVVVATISNQSTAGERVGVQAFGVEAAAVSLQLDEGSEVDYVVNWMAVKATQ